MARESNRLGELLVKEQLITPLQLKKAIDAQRGSGGRFLWFLQGCTVDVWGWKCVK